MDRKWYVVKKSGTSPVINCALSHMNKNECFKEQMNNVKNTIVIIDIKENNLGRVTFWWVLYF